MKRLISIITIIFIIMSGIFFANFRVVQEKALILYNRDKDVKTIIPVPNGKFTVSYLHSVHQTPVFETFSIDEDNRLILEDIRYTSLGVGMPYTDEGGAFINDDGEFVLYFDRTYDIIPIRVSHIPRHSLEIEGETYELSDFAKSNDRLEISATDRWWIKKIF